MYHHGFPLLGQVVHRVNGQPFCHRHERYVRWLSTRFGLHALACASSVSTSRYASQPAEAL